MNATGVTLSLHSSLKPAEVQEGFVPCPLLSVSVCRHGLNLTQLMLGSSSAVSLLSLGAHLQAPTVQGHQPLHPCAFLFSADCASGCRLNRFKTHPAAATPSPSLGDR